MKKNEYGERYQDHLLEQYKLYVEMADRVSARRVLANRFYISLLTGLLALLSIIIQRIIFSEYQKILFSSFAILGLILCGLWYLNIRSYRQLNTGKFKIIHEMEKNLPFPCYDREWKLLREGEKRPSYLQLTRIEQYVPFVMAVPYLILFLYSLFG